jgi:hypothetical protein
VIAALDIVDRLTLVDYRYLHATLGELLCRLGRTEEAGDAYHRALSLVHDEAERRLIERRPAALVAGGHQGVCGHRETLSIQRNIPPGPCRVCPGALSWCPTVAPDPGNGPSAEPRWTCDKEGNATPL